MMFETPLFVFFALAVYALWLMVRHNERAAVALLLTSSLLFYGLCSTSPVVLRAQRVTCCAA